MLLVKERSACSLLYLHCSVFFGFRSVYQRWLQLFQLTRGRIDIKSMTKFLEDGIEWLAPTSNQTALESGYRALLFQKLSTGEMVPRNGLDTYPLISEWTCWSFLGNRETFSTVPNNPGLQVLCRWEGDKIRDWICLVHSPPCKRRVLVLPRLILTVAGFCQSGRTFQV